MLRIVVVLFCVCRINGYFTLPGTCPEKVIVQEDFRMHQFFGRWYQVYHYSSDELNVNNCATVEINDQHSKSLYLNFSRIDADLVQRYSMGKIANSVSGEEQAMLRLSFEFDSVHNKLKTRYYPFRILATNIDYFSTVYTCSYSPLINKHFIYVWILSKIPLLSDTYKDLAVRPLNQIGVASTRLLKDDWSDCEPRSYGNTPVEPVTFRFPVQTHQRLSSYHEYNAHNDNL